MMGWLRREGKEEVRGAVKVVPLLEAKGLVRTARVKAGSGWPGECPVVRGSGGVKS